MAKKVKTTSRAKKKKIWVQIVAPKIFNEQSLGEIPLLEASSVIGRHITVNLMTLTKDMRKQNTSVQFEITELKGTKAHTKMIGLKIMPAAVKRLIRRNKAKIDESFVVETKDGVYVRLKPFLITTSTTHRSVLTTLRRKVRNVIAFEVKKISYTQLIIDIISNKLQRNLKDRMKKVYPIRISEIRGMRIINPDRIKYVKVVATKAIKEAPKKVESAPEAAPKQEEAPKAK